MCAEVYRGRGFAFFSIFGGWGYQAWRKGISLELIQAKLGHASPGVTRRYIGISADEIEAVENQVNL